ncbi:hypothetical protein DFH09DRAFT_1176978 [Mycena vulgaris]|nr:hypothetical protein DFH09DRAFT_1215474 [Mycena vulgaris]KAJ6538465.1 hypothetical protein DFH09DRAFT_1176978 [Mycena vulgaris]
MFRFNAGSNDLCYRCRKPGEPKLRRCARCHVTRYCSPECQREDWKLHKPLCVDHSTALGPMEENMKVFLKWLDHWTDALLAWGAISADLANQPPEYLLTHSYFLEVEILPPPEAAKHSPRSKCIALLGGMRTDDGMREELDRIQDLEYRGQAIETFKSFPRRHDKLRIVIFCYPFCNHIADDLANIFPDNKARLFSNPLSADSRLLSSALVRAWSELFPEHVRTGNVSGYVQVLQNLIQGSRALTEAALDVD